MSKSVKRLSVLLWSAVLLCVLFFTLTACFEETNKYRKNVSEIRTNILTGESEHFEIVVYTGEREEPYAMDGVANPMKNFFVVMVYPKFELNYEDKVNAEISYLGKKFTKQLTAHPFNGSYGTDFADLELGKENLIVNVTALQYDENVPVLSLLTENMMTADEAYKKGAELLKSSIENTLEEGKYLCEIQVKLVDKTKVDGKVFWHVSVFDKSGEMYAVLLEADKTAADESQT